MIDLHCAKNCLNCSNFSLMLNAGKEGSTGKLLTADKGEIKPFMPTKNFRPQFTMLIKKKLHLCLGTSSIKVYQSLKSYSFKLLLSHLLLHTANQLAERRLLHFFCRLQGRWL